VIMIDLYGEIEEVPLSPKRQVARRILDRVVHLRKKRGSRG